MAHVKSRPFAPTNPLIQQLEATYKVCSEVTLSLIQAQITPSADACESSAIVGIAQQIVGEEERFVGFSAETSDLGRSHVWPLGKKPAIMVHSASGQFYAAVSEGDEKLNTQGKHKGTAALPLARRPAATLPRLKIELFGRGNGGCEGTILRLDGPFNCKVPWGGFVGGGAFCSRNEKLFAFIAEGPRVVAELAVGEKNEKRFEKKEALFSTLETVKEKEVKEVESKGSRIDDFLFETNWGEQMNSKRRGRIYVVDFSRRSVQLLQPLNEQWAYGQPCWVPDGSGILCTGWDCQPYCLGLAFCNNRRAKVYLAQFTSASAVFDSKKDEASPFACIGREKQEPDITAERLVDRAAKSAEGLETMGPRHCKWLELSEAEDASAWSPVVLDILPSGPISNDTGSAKKDLGDTLRVAYLCLKADAKKIRPHQSPARIKVVDLIREGSADAWRVVQRKVLVEAPDSDNKKERVTTKSASLACPSIGIYTDRLPPWTDPNHLLVDTVSGPRRTVVCVNTVTAGLVYELSLDRDDMRKCIGEEAFLAADAVGPSLTVVDTRGQELLLLCSSLIYPPVLIYGKVDYSSKHEKNSSDTSVPVKCLGALPLGGCLKVKNVPSWTPYGALLRHLKNLNMKSFEADRHLLIRWAPPSRETKQRLLAVYLHGGPHATFFNQFNIPAIFLTMIGFDVLGVNYVGSIGFGEDEMNSLLGNIGKLDVDDVARVVQLVLASDSAYSSSRTVVVGGSHGGFLACHLAGQHPDLFAAAAARNPVTLLSALVYGTDIPDFCYAEGLKQMFDFPLQLTAEQHDKLYTSSPLHYVHNVKAPILLVVGADDQRVPPFQSILFYKALLGSGVQARLHLYPDDDHAINHPDHQADSWIVIGSWLLFYANNGQII